MGTPPPTVLNNDFYPVHWVCLTPSDVSDANANSCWCIVLLIEVSNTITSRLVAYGFVVSFSMGIEAPVWPGSTESTKSIVSPESSSYRRVSAVSLVSWSWTYNSPFGGIPHQSRYRKRIHCRCWYRKDLFTSFVERYHRVVWSVVIKILI